MNKITRDNLPHIFYCIKKALRKKWFSFFTRLFANWWGVKFGENNSSDGLPVFRRHPGSNISIGSECIFLSSPASNPAGLSKPCIFVTLDKKATIIVGDRCGFSGTSVSAETQIIIGNDVRCGADTRIMDTDFHTSEDSRVSSAQSVCIEDNVWLGFNVHVMKGVTIGKGTVVGANSLVTKSLPPGVVAVGSPAKVIRKIEF